MQASSKQKAILLPNLGATQYRDFFLSYKKIYIEYEIRRNDKILSSQGEAEAGHDDDNDVEGELN